MSPSRTCLLEYQCRQAGLGLADEASGQEPSCQWQLGVLHQAARRQRGLVSAALTLEELARTVTNDKVLSIAVPWDTETRSASEPA